MVSLKNKFKLFMLGLLLSIGLWLGLSLLLQIKVFSEICNSIEYVIFDKLFKSRPAIDLTEKILIIDIDNSNAIQTRKKCAQLIKKIGDSSVRTIGIDMVFDRMMNRKIDSLLVNIVNQYTEKLTLAYSYDGRETDRGQRHLEGLLKRYNIEGRIFAEQSIDNSNNINDLFAGFVDRKFESEIITLPFDPLLSAYSKVSVGHITFFPDFDKNFRNIPLIMKYGGDYFSSFALELTQRYLAADYLVNKSSNELSLKFGDIIKPLPFDSQGYVFINLIHPKTLLAERISLKDSLIFKDFINNPLGDEYDDAIVLIVNSWGEGELTDRTIYGDDPDKYPKWGFHVSVINQILKQKYIIDNPGYTFIWTEIYTIFLMIFLLCVEFRMPINLRNSSMLLFMINLIYLLIIYISLLANIRIYLFIPLIVICATYLIMRNQLHKTSQTSKRKKTS